MTFREEAVMAFLEIFEETKDKIKASEGCLHLELLQDLRHPGQLFTLSIWENEQALEAYR